MTAAALARHRYFPPALGFAALVAAVLFIEFAIRVGWLNRFAVAPPSEIVLAFERIVVEEQAFARFYDTFKEAVIAAVMLSVTGVSLGVLLYKLPLLRRATETWVAAMAAAPIVLVYPLFLVIFGRNQWTIIMIAFVAALPPVILKTIEGLAGTRRVLVNVGRSFNLTETQLFWKIMFPAAMPTIFTGLRLGLIFALINIVGVEYLINFGGLGHLVNEMAERYDLAGTYAAICFVILVSVIVFYATERLERWLRPGD